MEEGSMEKTDYGKAKEGPYGCFGVYPKWIQWMNTVGWLTVFMIVVASVYGGTVNGALPLSITTIEKRFGLNSRTSGIILSSHNIGFLISVLPLERLLRNRNRGTVLGFSCLLMSLSSLMFNIPHLSTKAIIPVTSNSTNDIFCNEGPRQATEAASNEVLWSILFIAVGVVSGFAMVPVRTIGHTCVEDEAASGNGGFNMGAISLSLTAGSIVGGLLTSFFLENFWCDISNKEVQLEPTNINWIGAWWTSFLIFGAIGLILAFPVFGFPNQFPGSSKIKMEKEINKDMQISNAKNQEHVKSGLTDYKMIFTNPVWAVGTIGRTCDYIFQTCTFGYGVKYIQSQYDVSAGYSGLLNIICGCGSIFCGIVTSLLLRRYKFSTWTCFIICSIVSVLTVITFIPTVTYFSCSNPTIDGVFDSQGKPIYPPLFETDCNNGCTCSRNSFFPICDVSTNVTYLTPCDVGCRSMNGGNFEGCTCADSSSYSPSGCPNKCDALLPFMIGYVLTSCFTGINLPLTLPAVTDTVESRLKSVQMGISLMFVRGIGGVCCPIIVGILLDKCCTVWQTSFDGVQGSCYVYDRIGLRSLFLWLPNIAKLISAGCYFIASELLRRKAKNRRNEMTLNTKTTDL